MGAAMEVLDNRRASFNKSKSKAKNAHKGWPLPKSFIANPDALAHAGFFFKPTKEAIDNVQCFMCRKELGGWDESDNPYEVHLQKCPKCPWAIARCSVEFDFYEDGQFSITDESRLPQNKVLEKARLDTFVGKSRWPHDASRTHRVKSDKMAAAGFVYTPQREGDDTSTCFYCDLTLSGWDEDDDPVEEHEKRKFKTGKPCPFFEAKVEAALTVEELKPNKNVRKSNAPKKAGEKKETGTAISATQVATAKGKSKSASRSKKSVKSEVKVMDLDEDEDIELREDDDPSLKVQPEPLSKPKTKKSTKKSLAVAKVTASTSPLIEEEHEDVPGHQSDTGFAPRERTRTQSGKKAAPKESSKKRAKAPTSPVDGKPASNYQDFEVDVVEEESRKGRTTKTTRARSLSRSKSKTKTRPIGRQDSKPQSSDNESRPPSRASSKPKVSEIMEVEDDEITEIDDSQAPPEPEAELKEPERKPAPKAKAKANKAKSTGSKGKGRILDAEKDDFGPAAPEEHHHERTSSQVDDLGDVTNTVAFQSTATPHVSTPEHSAPAKKLRQKDLLNVKRVVQRPGTFSEKQAQATAEEFERQLANDDMDVDRSPVRTEVDAMPHVNVQLTESPPASPSPEPSSRLPSKRHVEAELTYKQSSASGVVDNALRNESIISKTIPMSQLRMGSRETSPSRPLRKPGDDVSLEQQTSSRRDSEKENKSQAAVGIPRSSQSKAAPPAPATPERQILRFVSPRPASPSFQRPTFSSQCTPSPIAAAYPMPNPEETRSPSPPFLPPLATVPRVHSRDLTAEERGLTVEQWIRSEMEIECELLRKDGERRIQMFKQRAEEVRREIEAL